MKNHSVFLLNLVFLITIPLSVLSEPLESPNPVTADTVKNEDSDERVVHPATDPMVFYDPVDPIFEMQSGIYVGTMDIGAEFTVMNRYYDFYATLFGSYHFGLNRRVQHSQRNLHGGVTFGKEVLLRETGDFEEGTRYYARVGPGISFSQIVFDNIRDERLYFGLHSSFAAGATGRHTRVGRPYIDVSLRTVWFPALDDAVLNAGLQISVGFLISGNGGNVPVRFR